MTYRGSHAAGAAASTGPSESGDGGSGGQSPTLSLGLYRTLCPVGKSGKILKSGLSENRTFSFQVAWIFNTQKNWKKKKLFFFKIFLIFFCLFITRPNLGSRDHILRELTTHEVRISPVRQDLSCKFGCPVPSSQEPYMDCESSWLNNH